MIKSNNNDTMGVNILKYSILLSHFLSNSQNVFFLSAGEPDISTRKTLVSVFPDPTPQTHHVMSVTLIAAIVTGIICSIPVFGIVIYLIVNGVRKNKSVFHVSRSVHLNPVTTDE